MVPSMKNKRTIEPRIGIDIGKVIMSPVLGGKADTSFLSGGVEKAMQTPPSPGAFEGVKKLVEAFSGKAWLISKAGPNVQQKTKLWLRHWDFYKVTGLPQEHLRFCLERPQKAAHCKQLLITHFIDDRLDVLEALRENVPTFTYSVSNRSWRRLPPGRFQWWTGNRPRRQSCVTSFRSQANAMTRTGLPRATCARLAHFRYSP
jgi:hypothetical protein